MKSLEAVVFDLDDVLYPQWEYALGGYRAVANYMMTVYGTPIYEELAKRHSSKCAESLLADVLAGHFENVDSGFLERLIAVYWSHKPQINLFPDAQICLAFTRAVNVKAGIVTDGRSDIQRAKIKALGLEALADPVLFVSDLLGDNKMIDSLQMAELLTGIPLSETAYVGNAESSDFRSARIMGMYTVLIRRPLNITGRNPESPDSGEWKSNIDIVIPSLAELHHLIDDNQNVSANKPGHPNDAPNREI